MDRLKNGQIKNVIDKVMYRQGYGYVKIWLDGNMDISKSTVVINACAMCIVYPYYQMEIWILVNQLQLKMLVQCVLCIHIFRWQTHKLNRNMKYAFYARVKN